MIFLQNYPGDNFAAIVRESGYLIHVRARWGDGMAGARKSARIVISESGHISIKKKVYNGCKPQVILL
jgi:hypothetical protein